MYKQTEERERGRECKRIEPNERRNGDDKTFSAFPKAKHNKTIFLICCVPFHPLYIVTLFIVFKSVQLNTNDVSNKTMQEADFVITLTHSYTDTTDIHTHTRIFAENYWGQMQIFVYLKFMPAYKQMVLNRFLSPFVITPFLMILFQVIRL